MTSKEDLVSNTPNSDHTDEDRMIVAPSDRSGPIPSSQLVTPITKSMCTRDFREKGGRYTEWSQAHESSIADVVRGRDPSGNEDSFLIEGDATQAHVLSVTFTSGDSFGGSSGQIGVIHVFGSMARAEAAKAIYEASKEQSNIMFEDDFGRSVRMSDPAGSGEVYVIRESVDITSYPLA